jgi:hypothetical protein
MKKLVAIGIFVLLASFAMAQSPQQVQKKTFAAKVQKKPRPAPSPPPLKRENTTGVLVRAAQGNPLQMLNPKAPPQYGKAEDSVEIDPDTGKWKGIKLLSINF